LFRGKSDSLKKTSLNIILKYQTPSGSYPAAPFFPPYQYCWVRDGSFIAYSMDLVGQHESASRFHSWVASTIDRYGKKAERAILGPNSRGVGDDEFLHARYNLDGTEGPSPWPNKQFDGYGAWLWALTEHVRLTGNENLLDRFKKQLNIVSRYVAAIWTRPCYDCWEENPDKIHTSTLACMAGGLESINAYLKDNDIGHSAKQMETFIRNQCVNSGAFGKYFEPATKSASGIDASLIWLAHPFSVVPANDPVLDSTITKIETSLVTHGVHRYPGDEFYGGGEWIILSAWLAWHYLKTGRRDNADSLIEWVESTADEDGQLPEQTSHSLYNPRAYDKWVKKWGQVAKPLLWSHAMYIVVSECASGLRL
jgi:GH15 family glucan-1,4-alpha-glucosidase